MFERQLLPRAARTVCALIDDGFTVSRVSCGVYRVAGYGKSMDVAQMTLERENCAEIAGQLMRLVKLSDER
jgi:hypothetical protein